jgi:hypothetical protein
MKWDALMNGEVDQILQNIPSYKGCFPKDKFRGKIKLNECGVINLDDSTGSGTHFTCYFNSNQLENVFYFDSYGVDCPIQIAKYLKSSGKKLLYNTSQYQPIDSQLCGYYCCYVINEMTKGNSYYDTIYALDFQNPGANDKFIKKYSINNFPEFFHK